MSNRFQYQVVGRKWLARAVALAVKAAPISTPDAVLIVTPPTTKPQEKKRGR